MLTQRSVFWLPDQSYAKNLPSLSQKRPVTRPKPYFAFVPGYSGGPALEFDEIPSQNPLTILALLLGDY
jgi:hypothetical protein